jgi:uncharacterized protein (TIGR00251 family)
MARIEVRLHPRAKRDGIAGEREGALVVRVSAPPVEGKANEALRRLIAKRAHVPLTRVAIVRGHASRDKVVEVEGLDERELRRALGLRGVTAGPRTRR